ncbi:MAG: histidine phosphatase family protein [Anaerovoracaceae bacterium]
MRLYLARHGETDWNRLNKVMGRTDVPLNEKGLAQADALAGEIKEKNIPLDVIYCSPLTRAVQTAGKAGAAAGCPVITRKELIEMDFGIYEGVQRTDPDYQAAKHEYFKRYPGGESFLDVAARAYTFLNDVVKNCGFDNVMIVSHNGIARIISSYFIPMGNDDFTDFTMGNCEIREFDL